MPTSTSRNRRDIDIRDLVVRGANAAGGRSDDAYQAGLEAQHAIEIQKSTDVTITGCELSKTYGDGIYIGQGAERIIVRHCSIHHTGRQGIAITSGRNVFVQGNDIYEIRRSAFDLEPNSKWPIEHVRIQDNRVGPARLNFVSGHGRGSTFDDVSIVDNELTGEMEIHMKAPAGTRRGSVLIQGNRSTQKFGSPHALFTLIRYDRVVVTGNENTFDGRHGGIAVETREGCEVEIRDNRFTNVETQQRIGTASDCPPPDSSPDYSLWLVHAWLQARVDDGLPVPIG